MSQTHLVPAELLLLLVVSGKEKQERKTRTDRRTEEGKITGGVVCVCRCLCVVAMVACHMVDGDGVGEEEGGEKGRVLLVSEN